MLRLKTSAFLCCFLFAATGAAAQVGQEKAAEYFKEADALCKAEGGRLWGISLCGPIVIADATTGTIATSRPAPTASRPRALGFANAAMMWGDTRWTTVVWQLIPQDRATRARLFGHELFHRVQFDLQLMVNEGDNSHLDTLDGRYWLQLEWRALAAALTMTGDARTEAIRDALAFRHSRHAAFPGSADQERRLLINEGLAQYTGTVVAFSTRADATADVTQQLAEAAAAATFVRTFPYSTGAAYGLLLDETSPGWTRRITSADDPVDVLTEAASLTATPDVAEAGARYDAAALRASEVARDVERQARLDELTRRFVDGPVLILPAGRNAAFITTGLTPIPGVGTVYQQYRVSGDWGSVETTGVLVSTDRTQLTLSGPFKTDGSTLTGDGWTVSVAKGWQVKPGERPGSFILARVQEVGVRGDSGALTNPRLLFVGCPTSEERVPY